MKTPELGEVRWAPEGHKLQSDFIVCIGDGWRDMNGSFISMGAADTSEYTHKHRDSPAKD